MKRLFNFLIFLSLFSTVANSQSSRSNNPWSLQKINETNIPAFLIHAENIEVQSPDTALSIYKKILEVLPYSKSGIDYCRNKAKVLNSIAYIYIMYKADYDAGSIKTSEALKLYDILLSTSHKDEITNELKVGQCNSYLNLGRINEKRGFFVTAIQYYLSAQKTFSEQNDDKNVAKCYINIGSIHDQIADYRNSHEYYIKALQILNKYDTCIDLGECLLYFGDSYDGLDLRDSSSIYYSKALKVYKKLNNAVGMGQTYCDIAETYVIYDSCLSEKNARQAKKFFSISLGYLLKSGDMFDASETYSGLSNLYNKLGKCDSTRNKLGKYDSATVYSLKALKIADNLKSIYLKCDPYHFLSTTYEGRGKTDSSLIYFKKYKDIYDSLYSEGYQKVSIDVAVKGSISSYYNDLQVAKLRIKQNWITILVAIILLIVIFVIIIYYAIRRNILNKNKIKIRDSLIEGEEKERNRIGRELHDGVCSELAAVKMNLDIIKPGCSDQTGIEKVISHITTTNESIRNLSHDLNSMVLLKFGLIPAIHNLFEKIENLNNCKTKVEISEFNNHLEKSIETTIYRIIQEIVNNIIKHSRATEISIYLCQKNKNITILINDNGVGFDVKSEKAEKGIGLNNIRYRVALLNGKIEILSEINAGTKFIIEFPIAE
jgi:signal transduction histidine kinase